ncbi:MAG: hypothetical protein II114_04350, partial [Treponema sp.]|nr:hypothetical protein [Treponema sp.]
ASIAERNGSTGWNAPYKTLDEIALKNNLGSQLVGSTDDTAKVGKIEYTVSYMVSNEFRDGDNQKLKLLVKDSTPGESMEAEVSVILNLALRDSNPPVIKIRPFYWNSSAENSLFGNSTENGHIELPSDLPESFVSDGSGVDDRQPKVSGKIKIEGIAQDDAQLRVIKLDVFGTEKTVGTYNGAWEIGEELTSGGEIPASGYAFTVEQAKYADLIREGIITAVPEGKEEDDKVNYFSAEYGHVVKWTAYIDTAKVMTDAAETDREIKAYAVDRGTPNATGSDYENPNHSEDNDVSAFKEDGDNEGAQSGGTNGSGVHTDFYAVDVVPYITDVTTALSLTKKNNPSVYSRSALGHYPVAATETVKMTGFNLAGGTVKFNAETGTADVAYNASGFAIPSGAKSGNVSISVNGVGSLNNKNGNDSHGSYAKTVDLSANPTGDKTIYDNYYNRQPNGDNNNLLTDDVVLDIWQFKDAGISQTSGYITEPIMKVNPVNGILNFGFNSGPANYCMGDGQTYSYKTWVGNYARFSTCGFTVDENGVTHGITVGLDTNPGDSGSAGRLQYFTSKWGSSQLETTGNYEGKNSSRIDNIGAPAGTYNGVSFDGYVFIEDRFASPSLTTAVHGSDTYVYLAYYDDLNGQIRFKYGNLSKTTVGTSNTITTNVSGKIGISFEQFADQMKYGVGEKAHTAYNSNNKPEYYSVIAGSSQTAKAGNYLSIDVIKGSTAADDVVVATWYDATSGKWYYSYKVNPCNDNDMAESPSNTPTSGNWRKPIELKANAGENCQIAVDKVGGIHIASYDTENADLVYAYLSSYDDATPQVVTVDAYAFTGTNIRLDTAVSDDGGHIVPYIGYYMSSTQKPKMAYLPDVISASGIKADREAVTILQGADDSEAVTGNWESSIIPSTSKYADNYAYSYINIGLWKDASTGKAKVMSGTDVAYTNASGLKKENKSTTYGNGTANPVLAYATRVGTRGHLETAQMK